MIQLRLKASVDCKHVTHCRDPTPLREETFVACDTDRVKDNLAASRYPLRKRIDSQSALSADGVVTDALLSAV